ncbi:MAG: HD domain-containing protein, partial [Nitrospinaceae bacterium]
MRFAPSPLTDPTAKGMDHSLIEKTRRFVQDRFAGEGSGHDWWHLHRVWNLARVLADREGAERTVTEIAALLHDVADWKLAGDGEAAGLLEIRHLLTGDLPADALNHV